MVAIANAPRRIPMIRVVEKITQQCAQAGGMSGSPTAALVESEDLKLEFSCALEQQQQRLCGTMVGAL